MDDNPCIYKPPNYPGPIAQNATLCVKFSNNTFIHKSAFERLGMNIPDDEKLDESFMGLGIYKLDNEGNISEKWKKYVGNQ